MTWEYVQMKVLQKNCHEDIKVQKFRLIHPKQAGFYESFGDPQGQRTDYRKPLKDNRCIHAREFEDYYCIHWDYFDPVQNLIGHMVFDAPHWLILLSLAGIGFYALYRKKIG